MNLLEVRNLEVCYGGIRAVAGIDLQVAAGEKVCLIGANGAGKTTTLKAIAGLLGASGGSVELAGEPITRRSAHHIARLGLSLAPEGRGIFPRMSVAENLQMGAYLRRDRTAVRSDLERIYGMLPRLAERRTQAAGLLSGGEQQMLALARAMMARPRLLLLDEPSMGLAPLMVAKIFDIIDTITREGVSLLLVEQNAHWALKTCDRGYVLEQGQITLAAARETLASSPVVRAAYLGED
jgi:branched-chain amino acid transport system ATP-binding protein